MTSDGVGVSFVRMRDARIRWAFLAMLTLARIVVLAFHEPWRDEVHSVLASQFPWIDYMRACRGAMFPAFYLGWWALYKLVAWPVLVAQAVTVAASLGTAYLVLFRLRLPKTAAMPIVTGFYVFYEYGVFAGREHTTTALAMALFTWCEIDNKPILLRLLIASFLLLLHPLSFIIGGSYAGYLALTSLPSAWRRRGAPFGFALAGLCALLTLWWTRAPYRGFVSAYKVPRFEYAFFDGLAYIGKAFFGFSRNWNLYEYDLIPACLTAGMIGGLAVLGLSTKVLPGSRLRAAAIGIGLGGAITGLLSVFILRYHAQPRHVGLIYCSTLSYAWIARHKVKVECSVDPRRLRAAGWTVWGLSCFLLTVSSFFLSGKDLCRTFSQGRNVAHYLQTEGLADSRIVVVPEWSGIAIAAHLEHPRFHWPSSADECGYTVHTRFFDLTYRKLTDTERIAAISATVMAERPVIITIVDMGAGLTAGSIEYERVAVFDKAMVRDENYYIYRPASVEQGRPRN